MKIYAVFSLPLFLLIVSTNIFSQVPMPSATPPADDADVVKISTSLIQIDVTVTDKNGNIVPGLRAEDFQVFENGERQKITNFSFVAAPGAKPPEKNAVAGTISLPVPAATLRPEKIRRTIALVVDDLSLSFESTYQVRRTLKKYVDEQVQDGDLVAIIRTGAGIGALQQFTSDKRLLYAAIERIRWNPLGGKIGAFAPIQPSPLQQLRSSGDDSISDEDIEAERNAANSFEDFQGSVFATGTLGALRYIIGGMSELPGRKSVVLFSEGFRLMERDTSGHSEPGRVMDFLRRLIDQANRSSVVFYTVDARGLQAAGFTAEDNVADTSPAAMEAALSDRRDELFETQDGLRFLAAETGGFAVLNSNDLSGGLRRVLNDQSYYLLAYEPDTDTFDAAKRRFNRLEVRVGIKDIKVRYRSGFFNVAERSTEGTAQGKTPIEQIRNALTTPFAVNGITLKLNALFGNDTGNRSFVRSLLHVDGRDLQFVDQPDGSKKAMFDILAASFGDNGEIVEQLGRSYTINVRGDAYTRMINDGFLYNFTFPVKKAGAYQYRVAIRDPESGKVGSASQFVEVPNLKKGRLTLSSIVMENISQEQWKKLTESSSPAAGDAMNDTALRRAKIGSVLHYGYEIYNAKAAGGAAPNVAARIRIFRDGELVLDGKQTQIDIAGQTDMQRLKAAGAISLGGKMLRGDYILQIIVSDLQAKEKQNTATQYIQFEVVQ